MSDFNENARASQTSQHWADAAALRALSLGDKVRFTRYARKVLPLDGFVYWMSADAKDFEGAIFRDTTLVQNEDETSGNQNITFTALEPIQEFEQASPDTLWVGEYDGIKFAFSRLAQFFEQAGIYYYTGLALQSAMLTQLIDSRQGIDDTKLIVSNSLPAWLSIVTYAPVWLQGLNPGIVLYPSFAVPQNLRPPYGSVHIEPSLTRALQSAPFLSPVTANYKSHFLLATDTVRVTLYGADNDMAANFMDTVNQFSYDTNTIGMMNMPVIVDEKRTQVEMGVLAMKKTITYEVSYNQSSMREIARKLINSAIVSLAWKPSSDPVVFFPIP